MGYRANLLFELLSGDWRMGATMKTPDVLEVPFDREFQPYIPAALLRLGYLYPEVDFSVSEKGVLARCATPYSNLMKIKRDIMYQVYREKIFHETLEMRLNLYKMLAD